MKYPGGGGEGYSWEFLVGACRPVLQILTRFQTKKVIFHTCFQTGPLKSIPVFRPGLSAETILSLLKLEGRQKNTSNPHDLEFSYFSLFPIHLQLKR